MADDEIALARKAFDRWASGDWEPHSDVYHPDIEIASFVAGRSLIGYGGLRHWGNDLKRSFDDYVARADEWIRADDGRVLAVGRLTLRGRSTGETVDRPCAWLFAYEEALIVRIEAFHDRVAEARAEAGLPEDPEAA